MQGRRRETEHFEYVTHAHTHTHRNAHTQPLSSNQKRLLFKEVVTKIIGCIYRDIFQSCSFNIIIILTVSVWVR